MKYFSGLLFLTFIYFNTAAQEEFEKVESIDGIDFMGQWEHSKRSDESSQLQLNVKVANTNDYKASVKFNVVFFDTGVEVETSMPIELCIKPGKSKKGRKYGLSLISESMSNEKIESKAFTWSVSDVEVQESSDCK